MLTRADIIKIWQQEPEFLSYQVCPSCFHRLDKCEGEEGSSLICLNEMCLDETTYSIKDKPKEG